MVKPSLISMIVRISVSVGGGVDTIDQWKEAKGAIDYGVDQYQPYLLHATLVALTDCSV